MTEPIAGTTPEKKPKRLTPQQRMFVERYLTHWNASRAAREAGYSEDSSSQLGYQLLQNPSVRERVSERLAEAAMPADEALARLGAQARGDLDDMLNERGEFDLDKARALGATHLIRKLKLDRSETETGTHTSYAVEGYSSQAALVHILKAHGMFIEKHEHSGTLGIIGIEVVPPTDDDR